MPRNPAMNISRRTLLGTVPALGLAACVGVAPGTTTTSTLAQTLAADEQLLANGLAAVGPLVNGVIGPAAAAAYAQVQALAVLVAKDQAALVAANPTGPTTVQTIVSLANTLGPAIIGLFPGGGTAVTIANAILGLMPGLFSAF